jgi:hypothetical protein
MQTRRRSFYTLFALLVLGAGSSMFAQNSNANSQNYGKAPAIDMRPVIVPLTDSVAPETTKPARPSTTVIPQALGDAIKKVQAEREALARNIEAQARINRDSVAEDRAVIRQQLRESIQQLRDQQLAVRKEIKERVEEMKAELAPDLIRVIGEVRFEGRGR